MAKSIGLTMDMGRFSGLIAIQQAIGGAKGDLQAVMDVIVNEASVMPQSIGVVVELRDADQLYYAAASGTSRDLVGLRLPLNGSLSGLSMLTGQPYHCEDSETDPRVSRAACRRVGLRSMIVVPIPHLGQTVGVLKYYSAEPSAYSEEDMLVAHLLVGPIAVGMSSVAEADALRAQIELQQLVKLKEQFVSTVSHELRTPLTSIQGSLKLLDGGAAGDLPEKATSLVSIASRNTARLKRLVDDLLDLDRMDAGRLALRFAPVDLGRLMADIAEQTEPFAEQTGVRLALALPPTPLFAETDADRLIQAIVNLVSNACKFAPAGSVVELAVAATNGQATIRIADQGPGVPPAFRARLFDRVAQSEHTHGLSDLPGTGLGLAISKGIVERLGGRIRLDDAVARGATFEIVLPLVCSGEASAA
jgi:signal transduction histidine kinase